jgi:AdoMet-dependent heme synthase
MLNVMASAAPVIRAPRFDVAKRPFIVIWEATRACALACRHCRADAIEERDPEELTTIEAIGLMAQVASFGKRPPLFVITGGDPFERPDLEELIEVGTGFGLSISVSPSGTPSLTDRNLQRLRAAGAAALSLSIDGASPSVHDGFRGVQGVFDRTVDAWRQARTIGLKVQINTTVTIDTVDELPAILHLVRSIGAMTWSVFLLVPTGRGAELEQLSAPEVEDVLHFLYDADKVVSVKATEAHQFRRVVLQRRVLEARGVDHVAALGLGDRYRRLREELDALVGAEATARTGVRRSPLDVGAGRGFVFVSHTGEVFPSGFLPLSAGNVRTWSLPHLYRTSPLFTSLRSSRLLRGRCGRCEFRDVCGGSRARAYATTADVLAEEPSCAYDPGSFPYPEDVRAMLGA